MLKRWRKKLFKSPLVISALCLLIAGYIRLVYHTSRKQLIIPEDAKPYLRGDLAAIFVFWHGKLLMMPMLCLSCSRDVYVMISNHADGEMIARTMDHFGIHTVRGSSGKSGRAVVTEALTALQRGDSITITPDGPRGPARKAQPGVARIAARAKIPVVPVSYSASRGKRINSWDSFLIPYPFCKLTFAMGAPVSIDKDNLDSGGKQVENSLNAIDDMCDSLYTHQLVTLQT